MNMAKLLAAAVLLLNWSAPWAQGVHKCVVNGQTVFQQAACAAGTGGAIKVQANVVEGNPAGESRLRAEAMRAQAVREAIARGAVINGMTDDEMMQVMGRPVTVNTDNVNGKVSRQYVFRYGDGRTQYIYTDDRGVYAMQDRPGAGGGQGTGQACYTDLEIRNAEVGINSVTLPPEERARRQQVASDMRRCRR